MGSDDDYSSDDLDELLSQDSGEEDRKPGDFTRHLKGQLKEPRFKTVNLRQLYELIQMGNVDLCPPYQRDVVWPDHKQIQLVQSLFLNYYVPPVIFAKAWDDGKNDEVRVCIDGKQRCTSIQKFIEGKIPFKSPNGTKFWYTANPMVKQPGRPLPGPLKRIFDNISIQVVEYDDLDMEEQRDIFQRVQMGVALSAAEKLQALSGPWGEWITELQKKYITGPGTIGSMLPKFDVKRGRPFQVLCSYIMIALGISAPAPSGTAQTAFLERTDPPEPDFRRQVEMALGIFVEICHDHYTEAFDSVEARVAPVEFWYIAYLIHTRMGNMSVARLASSIAEMRKDVRSRHVDIRSNSKVGGDFYRFVSKVPRTRQPGEEVAAESFSAKKTKRRRETEDDEAYTGEGNNTGTYKGQESAVVENLRSKKPKKVKSSPKSPRSPQQAPQTATSTAPIPSSHVAQVAAQQQAQNTAQAWAHANAALQYITPTPAARPPPMPMDAPLPVQNQAPPPYDTQTVRNSYNQQNGYGQSYTGGGHQQQNYRRYR